MYHSFQRLNWLKSLNHDFMSSDHLEKWVSPNEDGELPKEWHSWSSMQLCGKYLLPLNFVHFYAFGQPTPIHLAINSLKVHSQSREVLCPTPRYFYEMTNVFSIATAGLTASFTTEGNQLAKQEEQSPSMHCSGVLWVTCCLWQTDIPAVTLWDVGIGGEGSGRGWLRLCNAFVQWKVKIGIGYLLDGRQPFTLPVHCV